MRIMALLHSSLSADMKAQTKSCILNHSTRQMWLSDSHPYYFSPDDRAHGDHWTGSRVGPRAGLDIEAKNKPLPPQEIEPVLLLYSLYYSHYIDCLIQTQYSNLLFNFISSGYKLNLNWQLVNTPWHSHLDYSYKETYNDQSKQYISSHTKIKKYLYNSSKVRKTTEMKCCSYR
jgi:hypothetical protein